jgi:Ni2+-binding GTPase involved in maturation of urease and hydrogenase
MGVGTMTETKPFHISIVLTIIDGKMISVDHIGGVYEILNWMTGENLMTHQLPRVSREVEPHLRAQHPALAAITVPEGLDSWDKVHAYLETLYPVHGEFVDIAKLDLADHTTIDPISEIKMMRPDMPILTVNAETGEVSE